MATIKDIAIILKPNVSSEFENILPNLTSWLQRRKKNVYFLEKENERLMKIFKNDFKNLLFMAEDKIHAETDLIITLGGDGTLIGVSRKVTKNSPPIFGVNMGHLGFITEFSKSEFFEQLELTLKNNYTLSQLPLYCVEVFKKNKSIFKANFLNDLVINNNLISRMITLSVESNDEHVFNIAGDGLIISSPIGSTAYSLAAGGPIINPAVNAMAITPICAHSLTHRPLVIPDNAILTIKSAKPNEVIKLTLDGQETTVITSGEIIKVTKKKNIKVNLVKNPERHYYQTLKEKFTHGTRDSK